MLQEELVGNFSEEYSAREELKNDLRAQSDKAWSKVSDYVHKKTRGISTRHSRVIRMRAEEIAQDVLVSLYRSIKTYNPRYPLESWIHAAIRHKIQDELRNIKRRIKPCTFEEKYGDGTNMESSRETRAIDYREEFDKYLRSNRLKKSERDLLGCLYEKDLAWKTAAERLEIPLGTLKSRRDKSLKILRAQAQKTNAA